MIFSEPPQTPYDLHISIAGVPVRIHPMFWIVSAILGLGPNGDPVRMLLWTLAAFPCILIHELGHVAAFRYFGTDAHVVLHGFGGLAIPTGGRFFGRGVGRRENWVADFIISAAGPAAGFIFAAVIYLGLAASGHSPELHFDKTRIVYMLWDRFDAKNLNVLIFYAQFINIFWGLVNLLPVYPLDGGQIARTLFFQFSPSNGLRNSLILSIVTGASMAVFCYDRSGSIFMAMFFGFMAYSSFQELQQISGRGRW